MKFTKETADIFVPDGAPVEKAIARTTHMGIGAHPDDLEIMALEGILACFGKPDRWFCGVVVTDGAGSPRDALYAQYTDEQMRAVRRQEQKKAAYVGEYGAVAFLDHPSAAVKDPLNPAPKEDLKTLLAAAQPEVVYIHNLADKHPTHIGAAMHAVRAIRELPQDRRPKRLYGCEVWRDLDWMLDSDKVVFRLDAHENIAMSLVGIFDSQIVGGKRYDLATMGRRRAHATYHESHSVDASQMINFGMDLTPLIEEEALDVTEYVLAHIDRFAQEVRANLARFQS
jgi:LmbE family N-acetylglucosaminyl deacetylase